MEAEKQQDAKSDRDGHHVSHQRVQQTVLRPFVIAVARIPGHVVVNERRTNKDVEASNDCPKHEAYKVFVILQPNTVPSPRTMMIHLHHAFSADAAVMRSWRLHILALLAVSKPFKVLGVEINFNYRLFDR